VLARGAETMGVSFSTGRKFFGDGALKGIDPQTGRNYLRLSFSWLSKEDIKEGIRRLSLAIKAHRQQQQQQR